MTTLCCRERNRRRSTDVSALRLNWTTRASLKEQRYSENIHTLGLVFEQHRKLISELLNAGLQAEPRGRRAGTADENIRGSAKTLRRAASQQSSEEESAAAVQAGGEKTQAAARDGVPAAVGARPIITAASLECCTR